MKLRWHIIRNKVTVEAIKQYREAHGCGLYEARNAITNHTETLQYFNESAEQWVDVPTVVTELEPDLN